MPTISLRPTRPDDIEHITALERSDGMRDFVTVESDERHHAEFARDDIRYLSVIDDRDVFLGYVILAMDADGRSVELRRIVVDEPGRGIGARALALLHVHTRSVLGRTRIWLDVFDTNRRAMRAYENAGYRFVRTAEYSDGRALRIYEREL